MKREEKEEEVEVEEGVFEEKRYLGKDVELTLRWGSRGPLAIKPPSQHILLLAQVCCIILWLTTRTSPCPWHSEQVHLSAYKSQPAPSPATWTSIGSLLLLQQLAAKRPIRWRIRRSRRRWRWRWRKREREKKKTSPHTRTASWPHIIERTTRCLLVPLE